MKKFLAVLRLIIFIILIGLVIFFIYRLIINIRTKNSTKKAADSSYQQVNDVDSSTSISDSDQNSQGQDANSDSSSSDSSNSSSSSSQSDSTSDTNSSTSQNSSSNNSSSSNPTNSSQPANPSSNVGGLDSSTPKTGLSFLNFMVVGAVLSLAVYVAALKFS